MNGRNSNVVFHHGNAGKNVEGAINLGVREWRQIGYVCMNAITVTHQIKDKGTTSNMGSNFVIFKKI